MRKEGVTLDRGWAWIICTCSFLQHIAVDGITNSFGILFVELTQYFGASKSYIAWIGSIQIGVMHAMGFLASSCVLTYGLRPVGFIGALLATVGFALSFFATQPWHLFLTIGIGVGTGFCGMIFGFIVGVQQWFDKKVALAMGFSTTGSGIGSFVLAPLLELSLEKFGWKGSMLILAGLTAQIIIAASLLRGGGRKQKKLASEVKVVAKTAEVDEKKAEGLKLNFRDEKDKKSEKWARNGQFESTALDDPLLIEKQDMNTSRTSQPIFGSSNLVASLASIQVSVSNGEKDLSSLIDFSLLRNIDFDILLIGVTFNYIATAVPLTFLPDRAVAFGVDRTRAALLVSIMAIVNTVARAVEGIMAHYLPNHRRVFFALIMVIVGLANIASMFCYNFWTLALYGSINALAIASHGSLSFTLVRDCVGPDNFAKAMALIFLILGAFSLCIVPAMGWLYDITGTYDVPFITTGLLTLFGGVLLLVQPRLVSLLRKLCGNCCTKNQVRKDGHKRQSTSL